MHVKYNQSMHTVAHRCTVAVSVADNAVCQHSILLLTQLYCYYNSYNIFYFFCNVDSRIVTLLL